MLWAMMVVCRLVGGKFAMDGACSVQRRRVAMETAAGLRWTPIAVEAV